MKEHKPLTKDMICYITGGYTKFVEEAELNVPLVPLGCVEDAREGLKEDLGTVDWNAMRNPTECQMAINLIADKWFDIETFTKDVTK